jgi:hypothetical protein
MKPIEEMTIEIKTPIRERVGMRGDVVEMITGMPFCAINAPGIPDCRAIRINGTRYRKCEDFDAEYQARQFRMESTGMDF